MTENEVYSQIALKLQEEQYVLKQAKIGLCRLWSIDAVSCITDFCESNGVEVTLQVVEVEIESGLSHSFIKLSVEGKGPYLCDGTGAGKHGPYFGYEEESPEHLQNSHLDMLNSYLLLPG